MLTAIVKGNSAKSSGILPLQQCCIGRQREAKPPIGFSGYASCIAGRFMHKRTVEQRFSSHKPQHQVCAQFRLRRSIDQH